MVGMMRKRPSEPRSKVRETKPVKYRYNAYKFERVLHLIYKTMDGIYGWEVESFTNTKDVWHPSVDTEGDCSVTCDCPDFRFKKEPRALGRNDVTTVWVPEYQCKHIKMGIMALKKIGLLEKVPWPDLEIHHEE